MSQSVVSTPKQIATWRKVVVAILDFLFIFAAAGYVVGYMTGNLSENGFEFKGGPAFIVFAIIILYFVIFRRYLGGTVFQRLLGAR